MGVNNFCSILQHASVLQDASETQPPPTSSTPRGALVVLQSTTRTVARGISRLQKRLLICWAIGVARTRRERKFIALERGYSNLRKPVALPEKYSYTTRLHEAPKNEL